MTSTADVTGNLSQAEGLVAEAAQAGAELVLLPENFAVFDTGALWREGCLERDSGKFTDVITTMALRHRVWIIAGTLPHAMTSRVRARCKVFSPHGECVAVYDKMHLFDVNVADAQGRYRESDAIEPGSETVCVAVGGVNVGLSICYDLRFPGLFQSLRAQGAQLLTVPAAFTRVTGEAHWMTLLQARAIETQCYVIAANQWGRHSPHRETFGHSCVISPWGDVMACRKSEPGVVLADLDMAAVAEVRQRMPVAEHQRFGVIGPEMRS
jgi:nitrilase